MVTSEQKNFLSLRGYRVGTTCRQPNGHAVEYPRVRSDAFCKRYSQEVFPSQSAAWDHAWEVAKQDPTIAAKWYQYQLQLAQAFEADPFIPMDDFICQPA